MSKASNLKTLRKAGFNVPVSYVVNDQDGRKELEIIWNELSGEAPLVVRSSMGDEDCVDESLAGKYLSILGIESLDELEQAVYNVLSSGNEEGYRAALIQPLIHSVISGVLFTSSPFCSHHMVLESSYGSGELVVGGIITPDLFLLNKHSGNVTYEISTEKRYGKFYLKHPLSSGDDLPFPDLDGRVSAVAGNMYIASFSYQTRTKSSLPMNIIKQLFKLGAEIESIFGRPQDIEWTYDYEKVCILQTRAITRINTIPKTAKMNYSLLNPINSETSTDSSEKFLKGNTASVGVGVGKIVLLRPDTEVDLPDEDYIVVAFETQPKYAYEMCRAKAIITETGGILSHAAIVARELGIPCVVGVNNLMDTAKRYSFAEVDGASGVVRFV
ncbi:PEP/pyruvate-binding domain-containing protein [Peribacillus deserti]|uniref:PEP-utilising enzyme mobile domain-containing protein n=1 Tax=Peribacillus deserti TaxID=673318 RepID=A0A2N5MBN0_9BACI|nr:PEP/pyruvate-binding domain-containing protein [Peribacillus deserti]PLT31770.1 hypothetical protein CUU66_01000 [Peribacillus deserti]